MPRRSNIEDIILSHDRRGISSLRPYLPSRFCDEAASLIMENNGGTGKTALITTGFYIPAARAAETDGPPGALALATSLKPLGFEAFLVTDKYTSPLLKPISE